MRVKVKQPASAISLKYKDILLERDITEDTANSPSLH